MKVEYELTPFFKDINLPKKEAWVDYFRLLYNEKDQMQERLTEASRSTLLKQCGISAKDPDVEMCLTGQSEQWNNLINGFFRHYHTEIYTEYCAHENHYASLVSAQYQPHDGFADLQKKTAVLKEMSIVRQMMVALKKEMLNNRGEPGGNVFAGHNAFKGTITESNANRRTRNPKSLRLM